MAQGESGRPRRRLANPPAAGLCAGARGDGRPAGRTPRRIVLLRNTVDGRTFCTAHKSQTVYHGPVVYADDPVSGRLEAASSDREAGHPTTNVGFYRNSAAETQQSWPHNRCN